MANQTKEELIAENDRLHAVIRDLEDQIAARDAVLGESAVPGWLITTPNPGYAGIVLGVRFESGRGFLPSTHQDAQNIALTLASDFGYTVQPMTAAEYKKLQAPVPPPADDFLSKILQPGRVTA